jgi:hypothetical protein
MPDSARILEDLVVIPSLARSSISIERPRCEGSHTLYVLSPKKWISSKPSSSTCLNAYVLSQPRGKTSNEIWPPMEKVRSYEANFSCRMRTKAARSWCCLQRDYKHTRRSMRTGYTPYHKPQTPSSPGRYSIRGGVRKETDASRSGTCLALRPIGLTLTIPLRNSTNVPLCWMRNTESGDDTRLTS